MMRNDRLTAKPVLQQKEHPIKVMAKQIQDAMEKTLISVASETVSGGNNQKIHQNT